MTSDRVVLCRPEGGLNDMLCQIERCCRYAEAFNRTVVVETDYRHARFFRDPISKYFVSRQERLVFKTDHIAAYCDLEDVAPAIAAGRLTDYRARYDYKTYRFVEEDSGQALSFDFNRDHPEKTLLHHDSGGGNVSIGTLSRMRLHDNLTDLLIARARAIGGRYLAVHIRNTDLKTRYEQRIDNLARELPQAARLFVATDNRNCLSYCRDAFGADRVFAFAKLPAVAGQALHAPDSVVDIYEANRDAILDLVMLGLAANCYAFELEKNEFGVRYSGFSVLALTLQATRPVLSQLISRSDPALDRLVWSVAR
jgi:hypothetical protein